MELVTRYLGGQAEYSSLHSQNTCTEAVHAHLEDQSVGRG